MKQKKQSSLARILGYAGGHRNLTLLGCILSALSAVLGLIPMCAYGLRQGTSWKPGPRSPECPGLHTGAGRRYGPLS